MVRRLIAAAVLALMVAAPASIAIPAAALADSCPVGYSLVANEQLPVLAPPAGADLNRNGYQCAAEQGGVLLLTDDVPEDLVVGQCGTAFSPVIFEPTDLSLLAKDRNGDGVVCIRVIEVLQADALEIFVVRDN